MLSKKYLYSAFFYSCCINTKISLLFNVYEDEVNSVLAGITCSKTRKECFKIGGSIKLNYKMNQDINLNLGVYNYSLENVYFNFGLAYKYKSIFGQISIVIGSDGCPKISFGFGYYIGEVGDDELLIDYDIDKNTFKSSKKKEYINPEQIALGYNVQDSSEQFNKFANPSLLNSDKESCKGSNVGASELDNEDTFFSDSFPADHKAKRSKRKLNDVPAHMPAAVSTSDKQSSDEPVSTQNNLDTSVSEASGVVNQNVNLQDGLNAESLPLNIQAYVNNLGQGQDATPVNNNIRHDVGSQREEQRDDTSNLTQGGVARTYGMTQPPQVPVNSQSLARDLQYVSPLNGQAYANNLGQGQDATSVNTRRYNSVSQREEQRGDTSNLTQGGVARSYGMTQPPQVAVNSQSLARDLQYVSPLNGQINSKNVDKGQDPTHVNSRSYNSVSQRDDASRLVQSRVARTTQVPRQVGMVQNNPMQPIYNDDISTRRNPGSDLHLAPNLQDLAFLNGQARANNTLQGARFLTQDSIQLPVQGVLDQNNFTNHNGGNLTKRDDRDNNLRYITIQIPGKVTVPINSASDLQYVSPLSGQSPANNVGQGQDSNHVNTRRYNVIRSTQQLRSRSVEDSSIRGTNLTGSKNSIPRSRSTGGITRSRSTGDIHSSTNNGQQDSLPYVSPHYVRQATFAGSDVVHPRSRSVESDVTIDVDDTRSTQSFGQERQVVFNDTTSQYQLESLLRRLHALEESKKRLAIQVDNDRENHKAQLQTKDDTIQRLQDQFDNLRANLAVQNRDQQSIEALTKRLNEEKESKKSLEFQVNQDKERKNSEIREMEEKIKSLNFEILEKKTLINDQQNKIQIVQDAFDAKLKSAKTLHESELQNLQDMINQKEVTLRSLRDNNESLERQLSFCRSNSNFSQNPELFRDNMKKPSVDTLSGCEISNNREISPTDLTSLSKETEVDWLEKLNEKDKRINILITQNDLNQKEKEELRISILYKENLLKELSEKHDQLNQMFLFIKNELEEQKRLNRSLDQDKFTDFNQSLLKLSEHNEKLMKFLSQEQDLTKIQRNEALTKIENNELQEKNNQLQNKKSFQEPKDINLENLQDFSYERNDLSHDFLEKISQTEKEIADKDRLLNELQQSLEEVQASNQNLQGLLQEKNNNDDRQLALLTQTHEQNIQKQMALNKENILVLESELLELRNQLENLKKQNEEEKNNINEYFNKIIALFNEEYNDRMSIIYEEELNFSFSLNEDFYSFIANFDYAPCILNENIVDQNYYYEVSLSKLIFGFIENIGLKLNQRLVKFIENARNDRRLIKFKESLEFNDILSQEKLSQLSIQREMEDDEVSNIISLCSVSSSLFTESEHELISTFNSEMSTPLENPLLFFKQNILRDSTASTSTFSRASLGSSLIGIEDTKESACIITSPLVMQSEGEDSSMFHDCGITDKKESSCIITSPLVTPNFNSILHLKLPLFIQSNYGYSSTSDNAITESSNEYKDALSILATHSIFEDIAILNDKFETDLLDILNSKSYLNQSLLNFYKFALNNRDDNIYSQVGISVESIKEYALIESYAKEDHRLSNTDLSYIMSFMKSDNLLIFNPVKLNDNKKKPENYTQLKDQFKIIEFYTKKFDKILVPILHGGHYTAIYIYKTPDGGVKSINLDSLSIHGDSISCGFFIPLFAILAHYGKIEEFNQITDFSKETLKDIKKDFLRNILKISNDESKLFGETVKKRILALVEKAEKAEDKNIITQLENEEDVKIIEPLPHDDVKKPNENFAFLLAPTDFPNEENLKKLKDKILEESTKYLDKLKVIDESVNKCIKKINNSIYKTNQIVKKVWNKKEEATKSLDKLINSSKYHQIYDENKIQYIDKVYNGNKKIIENIPKTLDAIITKLSNYSNENCSKQELTIKVKRIIDYLNNLFVNNSSERFNTFFDKLDVSKEIKELEIAQKAITEIRQFIKTVCEGISNSNQIQKCKSITINELLTEIFNDLKFETSCPKIEKIGEGKRKKFNFKPINK